jgi:hypothetical protein
MTLTLTASSGLLKGNVTLPGAIKATPFQGAVHRLDAFGAGFFLDASQSGGVLILPDTP